MFRMLDLVPNEDDVDGKPWVVQDSPNSAYANTRIKNPIIT